MRGEALGDGLGEDLGDGLGVTLGVTFGDPFGDFPFVLSSFDFILLEGDCCSSSSVLSKTSFS